MLPHSCVLLGSAAVNWASFVMLLRQFELYLTRPVYARASLSRLRALLIVVSHLHISNICSHICFHIYMICTWYVYRLRTYACTAAQLYDTSSCIDIVRGIHNVFHYFLTLTKTSTEKNMLICTYLILRSTGLYFVHGTKKRELLLRS